MMTFLAYLTDFILILIAGLHFLWGINVYWPMQSEQELARAVVGAKGITDMPGFLACSAVAAALLIGAFIVLRLGGVIAIEALPLWPFRLAGIGLGFVFIARGIIGYTSFWATLTPEEPFLTLNRQIYSPLCLALGASVISLVIWVNAG